MNCFGAGFFCSIQQAHCCLCSYFLVIFLKSALLMNTKIKNYKRHIFEEFCFAVVGHFFILTTNLSSFIYFSWIPCHKSARRWGVFFMATHFGAIYENDTVVLTFVRNGLCHQNFIILNNCPCFLISVCMVVTVVVVRMMCVYEFSILFFQLKSRFSLAVTHFKAISRSFCLCVVLYFHIWGNKSNTFGN